MNLEEVMKIVQQLSQDELATLDKAVQKTSRNFTKHVSKMTKSFKEFKEEYDEVPNLTKQMAKLNNKMEQTEKHVEEMTSDLEKMGVIGSKKLTAINTKLKKTQEEFIKLGKASGDVQKLQSKLAKMPKSLENIKKGLSSGFSKDLIKDFSNSLGDLEGQMDSDAFKKLKQTIDKALSTDNIEDAKKASIEMSKVMLKEFGNIKDLEVFEGLPEDAKKLINELQGIDAAGNNAEYLKGVMADLEKIMPSVSEEFGNFVEGKEQEMKKLTDNLKEASGVFKELTDTFRDASYLTMNLGNLESEAYGLIREIQQRTSDVTLFSADTVDNVKKIEGMQRMMAKDTLLLKNINDELADDEELSVERKEKLLKLQKHINFRLAKQTAEMKQVAAYSRAYLDAAEEMDRGQYGVPQTAQLIKHVFKAHHRIDAMADSVSKLSTKGGGALKKLGRGFKSFGETLSKAKFGIGLLASAASLGKHVMAVDERSSAMYDQVVKSGLVVGESFENMEKSMSSFLSQSMNIGGLTAAVAELDGSFALSQTEIMGVVSGLNEAGLASRRLAEQIKTVPKELVGTDNALVGTSKLVRTFSSNMGVADGVVTAMMGDMSHQFNTTLGSMTGTFGEITDSLQKSGMSANRFLGILGTATAGMSLYEDQVKDTARAIASLGESGKLSGKEVETAAKSVGEFIQDENKVLTGLSFLAKKAPGQIQEMAASVGEKVSDLQVKVQSGTATQDEKDQLKMLSELQGYLQKGDAQSLAQASAIFSDAPVEIGNILVGSMLKINKQISKGNRFVELAGGQSLGLPKDLIKQNRKTQGRMAEEMTKLRLQDEANVQEQMKAASKIENKAGNATNELKDSLLKKTDQFQKDNIYWLKAITVALGMTGLGNIFSKFMGKGSVFSKLIPSGAGQAVKSMGSKLLTGGKNFVKGGGATAAAAFMAAYGSIENLVDMTKTGPLKWQKKLEKKFDDQGIVDNLLDPIDSITVLLSKATEGVMDKLGGVFDWFGDNEAEKKMADADAAFRKKIEAKMAAGKNVGPNAMARYNSMSSAENRAIPRATGTEGTGGKSVIINNNQKVTQIQPNEYDTRKILGQTAKEARK